MYFYDVNVNALYNFVNEESVSFGAFFGLGLCANTWTGNTIDTANDVAKAINEKLTKTIFNLSLNVDLRTEYKTSII